jgi:glucose uptake protein GlcU
VTISGEIEAFIRQHRGDGQLVGDATEPLPSGYQLIITCPCGVMFGRWVTPENAAIDLAALARLN